MPRRCHVPGIRNGMDHWVEQWVKCRSVRELALSLCLTKPNSHVQDNASPWIPKIPIANTNAWTRRCHVPLPQQRHCSLSWAKGHLSTCDWAGSLPEPQSSLTINFKTDQSMQSCNSKDATNQSMPRRCHMPSLSIMQSSLSWAKGHHAAHVRELALSQCLNQA